MKKVEGYVNKKKKQIEHKKKIEIIVLGDREKREKFKKGIYRGRNNRHYNK